MRASDKKSHHEDASDGKVPSYDLPELLECQSEVQLRELNEFMFTMIP